MIEFEWDPKKAERNLKKHGVSFREAARVFRDPLSITAFDPDHSEGEDRYITVGASATGRILMVAHTEHDDRIRIINARGLTRRENKEYEGEIEKRKGR